MTSGWPWHDFRPQLCITLLSGALDTKFGGHRAFLNSLTSGWPQLTPGPMRDMISYKKKSWNWKLIWRHKERIYVLCTNIYWNSLNWWWRHKSPKLDCSVNHVTWSSLHWAIQWLAVRATWHPLIGQSSDKLYVFGDCQATIYCT